VKFEHAGKIGPKVTNLEHDVDMVKIGQK
jgi:hypothetical protein